ncbi:hypothetical protein ASG36_20620 [Geodermatophilus sp. Leaf369]|uniref:hypothetical protein n=1 Tax=Geodermatophilus sp. Leaf369 TaxID=1736354 RepID=UPI0006FAC0EF|nr:hypothetical protein [Geodermatophilus sp. Leaf369]KQS54510.1 hypothetical protein ASG36_20620 [Geodermatophilus sp. Leaf369]
MTLIDDDGRADQSAVAREHAAALFAAAARSDRAGSATQLHCLAAWSALDVPSMLVPGLTDGAEPDELITHALRILGELDAAEFAEPEVLVAARHGRRALRGPR